MNLILSQGVAIILDTDLSKSYCKKVFKFSRTVIVFLVIYEIKWKEKKWNTEKILIFIWFILIVCHVCHFFWLHVVIRNCLNLYLYCMKTNKTFNPNPHPPNPHPPPPNTVDARFMGTAIKRIPLLWDSSFKSQFFLF